MRPPNDWPEAQLAFEVAYRADPAGFDRRPAFARWREVPEGRGVGLFRPVLLPVLLHVVADPVIGWPEGRNVAIWPVDAPRRAPADLVITVRSVPSGAGESTATVVGEYGLNGACCIELDGDEVLWPSYNPLAGPRRPRR